MPKRESLFSKYPDYRVDLEPNSQRIHVSLAGETLADSTQTLTVRETKHDPVVYFPKQDVRFDLLEGTQHTTFCPFKGDASYWTARVRDGQLVEDNVVWGYADPFDEVAKLKGYVSFYPDRVEWHRGEKGA